jgi:hypothetical protein
MKIAPVICRIIITVWLSATASSYAQGNLVNLNNWTVDTNLLTESIISITSSNSAIFSSGGALANPPSDNESILNGNIDTTVGLTYEIAFTMQNTGEPTAYASMSFGNFTTNLTSEINGQPMQIFNGMAYQSGYAPVNFDFTVVATSAITTGAFDIWQDNSGYYVGLSNFSVVAVPEASTTVLMIFGGYICLLTLRQSSFLKRNRS